ncbi:hypothetical protein KGM_205951 [Danaus plexippus plexippus]|uniref:Uncharacterized protein n=1 Tax=Danaus plexippus plexippus TaxID=278856 RepID=A0A212FNW1_DANPL|nr:hypothetical protein KGM_205951 [Danaus plexippus plexippus]
MGLAGSWDRADPHCPPRSVERRCRQTSYTLLKLPTLVSDVDGDMSLPSLLQELSNNFYTIVNVIAGAVPRIPDMMEDGVQPAETDQRQEHCKFGASDVAMGWVVREVSVRSLGVMCVRGEESSQALVCFIASDRSDRDVILHPPPSTLHPLYTNCSSTDVVAMIL